jgi:hypothetical protein
MAAWSSASSLPCVVYRGEGPECFGKEIALCDSDVAEQVAGRELARGVGPVDFVGRKAAGDAHSAFADIFKILEKGLDSLDFHRGARLRMKE